MPTLNVKGKGKSSTDNGNGKGKSSNGKGKDAGKSSKGKGKDAGKSSKDHNYEDWLSARFAAQCEKRESEKGEMQLVPVHAWCCAIL